MSSTGNNKEDNDQDEEKVDAKIETFFSYENFTNMHQRLAKVETELAELKKTNRNTRGGFSK